MSAVVYKLQNDGGGKIGGKVIFENAPLFIACISTVIKRGEYY